MIKYANDINLKGLVLSDHEILSGHVEFIKEYKKLKENNELNDDFIIGLGNEIYMVLEDSIEELKENQANKVEDSQFFHFLLIATNSNGHYQLRQLSSIAWENSWRQGLVERTPTFKKDLKRIIQKGDVVASSACLGGAIPQFLLRIKQHQDEGNTNRYNYYKEQLDGFIEDCIDIFGKEHFYLEIQPSANEEQIYVNKEIIKLSKETGLRYTVATDGHYLKKEDRASHKYYLLAQNIAREVDEFYDATYIMSEDEVASYLDSYLSHDEIQAAFDATMEIYDKVEFYDLYHDTIVPLPPIPEYEFSHVLEQAYDEFKYIKKFAYSEHKVDRYFLHLIQEGLVEKIVKQRGADRGYFQKCLARINIELREIWLISDRIRERVSGYYVLTKDVIDLAWTEGDSIVGVARGSAAGYFSLFLTGIIAINPLDYDLPHFRHLTAERPELPDVDFDTQQNRREQILQAMKDRYGKNKVLNIATFSTEGPRSALLTAARGMQIDASEVGYLTALIPSERGFLWSLADCFKGNKELGRKPVTELANVIDKYDGLAETAMKIEGLVKSRSVHASGIYVFNDDYTKQNAMMKSSSGHYTTQFAMNDSDYQGALKLDALTVQGIDRIRTAMDLLVEHGYIEDKGSLRATYDAYLHPDVLVYDDREMWDKVANNEIPDLFQFDTSVGGQCAKKSKPQSVEELALANDLMRLMSEGDEQPIDKFVRHKESIEDWYKEMNDYKLTQEEIVIMEEHLKEVFGVSATQEAMMKLLLDERICGFTVAEANDARRVVGRKIMEDVPRIKGMIFAKGVASERLKKYIWDTQIATQMGYSFSTLHSTSYSLIALQEMNLAHLYPRVFWDVACLSVSAGADEDSTSNKSSNYGRIASGIGKLRTHSVKVTSPLINQASFGFIPDVEKNQIVFALKGINGINDDVLHTIIANRPYASFEDFHERMYLTKLVTRGQILQLIKAGCFNEFNTSPEIMKKFIIQEVDVKDSLNGQNLQRIINLGLLNTEKYKLYEDYFNFRKHLMTSIHETRKNPIDRIFIIKDDYSQIFFENNFTFENTITNKQSSRVEPVVVGEHNGKLLISEKAFKRQYDEKMLPVTELYADQEFLRSYNIAQFHELWQQHSSNSQESWYFEATSFYPDKHELEDVDEARYGIRKFSDLSETPVVLGERKSKNGRVYPQLETYAIAGTVLDKNKNSHSFTVLTKDDVVVCKTYGGAYSHYDRQIKINGKIAESSWLTRGAKILINGYRRDDQFVLRAASYGQHTINKITEIRADGTLGLQSERIKH